MPGFDAVILAGGAARRLGGADKPSLVVAGRPLLESVLAAAAGAGAGRLIVVGPPRPWLARPVAPAPDEPGPDEPGPGASAPDSPASEPPASEAPGSAVPWPGLRVVQEDPPGAGPVPALRRGLAEVRAPRLALLAADLPFLASEHIRLLLEQTIITPGVLAVDDHDRPQWLLGCWRSGPLRDALARYRGGSLGGLLGPLRPARVRLAPGAGRPPWLDCDTPEDLVLVRAKTPGNIR